MGTHTDTSRRALLRGAVTAGAGLTGLVAGSGVAHAAQDRRVAVSYDVACLVDTFRMIPAPDLSHPGTSPLYGAPFEVEGNIYDEGTIPVGNPAWDPGAGTPIGLWVCRGWIMARDERPEPEVITTQTFFFGGVSSGPVLSPADQLTCEGVESAPASPGWMAWRSVTGGLGRYAAARGVVAQHHIGGNTTVTGPGPGIMGGPNFRFAFEVDVWPSMPAQAQAKPATASNGQSTTDPSSTSSGDQLPSTGVAGSVTGFGLAAAALAQAVGGRS